MAYDRALDGGRLWKEYWRPYGTGAPLQSRRALVTNVRRLHS
jgi:hypothetical protein